MKKTHIIGIIIIALAIGMIASSLVSTSSYASFNESSKSPGSEFHVVGKLDKSKEMVYDHIQDANLFTFYMIDNLGTERKVFLHENKPQDFERSEQVVVIGKSKGTDEFDANKILMKCPSKYNDGKQK
jgi:cytochrome c-type biogenesis protein CcmE